LLSGCVVLPQRTGEAEGLAGALLFDFSFFEPQGQGDTEPFAFAFLPIAYCFIALLPLCLCVPLRLGGSKN
jgi:hypothetical protein